MADQNLAELCTLLIQNHLGELSAHIFKTLAEHGRLTLASLAEHSSLPVRRLKPSLANLLEEQLLLHVASDENAPSFYSVNWRSAYHLARHTNVVKIVEERYGEGAGQIVENVLQLGHARVGDLADAYELDDGSKRDSGMDSVATNGTVNGTMNGVAKAGAPKPSYNQHITTAPQFHSTVRTLLKSGVLAKVGIRAFVPPTDLQEQIEGIVIEETFPDGKVTGPKKKADFEVAVNSLKRKWREEDSYSDHRDITSRGSLKRPGEHFLGTNKRPRVNGGTTNGHMDDDSRLSNDLIVCVDFVKLTLAMRSQRLEQLARRFFDDATASVYGALLQSLEGKFKRIEDAPAKGESSDDDEEEDLPVTTLNEIADLLDPTIDLASSVKGLSGGKHIVDKKGKKNGMIVEEEDFSELGIKKEVVSDDEDEPDTNGFSSYKDRARRIEHIEAHLSLLEEHPRQFCKRVRAHGGSNEWRVNFRALVSALIVGELDTVIGARYGTLAVRIVRMLRDRGRLDEKQVGLLAMTRVKDVRAVLTQLQFHGIIEAQELPKDTRRQPSSTLYLWFVHDKRVQSIFMQQTFKAMARTLQRVDVEREKYRGVIEKAERSDVKGKEQEKLEQNEKVTLREWRETEERLFAQVARMDESIALLRDFSGRDTTLAA